MAPWYREISDGFCWLCYCMNDQCDAYKELVVINRGFIFISIREELRKLVCPCCKKGNKRIRTYGEHQYSLIIRNCGFVNCQWAMRGALVNNKESKIFSEGQTYDNKLYTFKEIDHRNLWYKLEICIKQLAENTQKNLSSDRAYHSSSSQTLDNMNMNI